MAKADDYGDEWATLAVEYASVRWCWDDCRDDLIRADMETERPDVFIDRMAEKWDLIDPATYPWHERPDVQAIKDRIELFWQGF